ncbi:MAG TPA: DUF4157 domain-containing protein [Steroidobacteraceae bacterium]|nr:DUF4157 domain-containing protein [Steroidobacteraceae bacterium]
MAGNKGDVGSAPGSYLAGEKMPDKLASAIERLSGIDVSDVRVHRGSSVPEKLSATAYAQGTHIHLGPGEDRYLAHEAWHVVQQRQGRVQPTMQLGGGRPINDNADLEAEADHMARRAMAEAG